MAFPRGRIYANALRTELRIGGRVDLLTVAKEFHLSIREADLSGCDGALLRSSKDSSGIIVVKSSIREIGRKRFTVAHEIGHRLLHGVSAACTSSDIGNWSITAQAQEREADEFAAELLIPYKECSAFIRGRSPSIQTIESVAEEFDVSLSASAWRYCDVVDLPCAMVWSTDEVIKWSHKSDSFQFFLQRGVKVPQGSYAMAAYKGNKLAEHPESISAVEWIDGGRLLDGAEIWEQSLSLPSYNSVITLLWVKGKITKDEVEEDTLLEELDPEEFTLRRKRWPGKR